MSRVLLSRAVAGAFLGLHEFGYAHAYAGENAEGQTERDGLAIGEAGSYHVGDAEYSSDDAQPSGVDAVSNLTIHRLTSSQL